ncbi:unnamed protein product, partial [Didymodactylos carnosus]
MNERIGSGIVYERMNRIRLEDVWFLYQFSQISFFFHKVDIVKLPKVLYHLEILNFIGKYYDQLSVKFTQFWSKHKEVRCCGENCSKAFVTDGFQKPCRFICSNVTKAELCEEMGPVTLGCGNRPKSSNKRKAVETDNPSFDDDDEVVEEDGDFGMCAACVCADRGTPVEEPFETDECNVERKPRFRNSK